MNALPMLRSLHFEEKRVLIGQIAEQIAQGRSLTNILMLDDNMPSAGTLYSWYREHPELKEMIDDARVMQLEKAVEEIIEIADNAPATKGGAAKARVRIMARERQALLMAPKRFKQQLDVTSGDKPLPEPPAALQFVQDNRMQALILLAAQRKQEDEERRRLLDD